jgi:hypothetical protein
MLRVVETKALLLNASYRVVQCSNFISVSHNFDLALGASTFLCIELQQQSTSRTCTCKDSLCESCPSLTKRHVMSPVFTQLYQFTGLGSSC